SADIARSHSNSAKAVVTFAKKLSESDLAKYLEELGKKRDFASLTAIYQSDIPNRGLAVGVYARYISSDKVVAFCTTFELRSWQWRAAFWQLHRHPKKKVIGYIKQIATSSLPEARFLCYEICRDKKWNDLLENALRDVHNSSVITLINVNETL